MRVPLTRTFKGLMYPAIQGGTGVNEGTKVFERKSNVPAVKGVDTKLFDRATAMVPTMPMSEEVDKFIKDLSVGKKRFRDNVTYLPADKQEVVAIVHCSWYEPDLPVAPSALPSQAVVTTGQEPKPVLARMPVPASKAQNDDMEGPPHCFDGEH